jgi:MFS transporter, PHS family, inorganic phosphate transporter
MNSPQNISKIWNKVPAGQKQNPQWRTEYDPTLSVYDNFIRSGTHALVVVSIGALLGGLFLIMRINRHNRKRLQWGGFLALFMIFIILGASFQSTVQTRFNGVAITLYVICQILFNFGQ